MIALETLDVADRRRFNESLAHLQATVEDAVTRFGRSLREVGTLAMAAMKALDEALRRLFRPGYYWRDGKWRRNHRYFRQRAKNRRAVLRRVREAARTRR